MNKRNNFFLLVACCVLAVIGVQLVHAQDGQLTWTQNLSNGGRVFAMAINPATPAIIYSAGLDSGVYKTTNAGVSWFAVNTGLTYVKVQALAICRSNPNVLYAGTDQNGGANSGIYVTTDAGANWTFASTGIIDNRGIQGISINPTNPSIAFAAVFDGVVANPTIGLYRTTDRGANWLADTLGIGVNKRFLCVEVNPFNGNTIYAGTSFTTTPALPSKIYKSVNGGNTWVDVSNGLPQLTTNVDPVRAFSISTADTNVVLAALFVNDTAGGAFLTTNGGALWVKRHNGLPATAGTLLRSCLIRPGSSTEFFVGLDGGGATSRGVWRTVNGGNNWVDFNSGTMLNSHSVRALVAKTQVESTLYAGNATTSPATARGVHEYSWPTHDIGVTSLTRLTSLDAPAPPSSSETDNLGENIPLVSPDASADVAPPASDIYAPSAGSSMASPPSLDLTLTILADTARFRAIVRNYGTIPETTYQVRWSADGVVQATLNNTRPLTVAGLDTFSFQWNNVPIGNHTVRAWTLLASDAARSNDTGTVAFTISPPVVALYDNGPLSTGALAKRGTVAPAGTTWSEVQNPAGDTTQSNTVAGFSGGITTTTRFRLADNFVVPAGQSWRIDSVWTYAYQTGSTPSISPFIALNAQIWNGRPGDPGAVVVAGDTLNRLTTSVFSTYYRIFNSRYPPPGSVPGTTRPMFRNTANMGGVTLGPGTYWLDWQTQITASGAHFAPTVTIVGRRGNAAWNGRQRTGTGWIDAVDAGNPAAAPDSAQDFPFQFHGEASFLPTLGWVTQTSGITTALYSVKAVSQNVAWAGGAGGRVLRTTNNGTTWTSVGGGRIGTAAVYAVDALDANTAFATTSPSATYIFRTTNGGGTWDTVFVQAGGFIDAIKMYDANNGIALGDPVATKWTILRTTNGGATWARIATEPTQVGGEAGSNNGLATFGTT
ncbi:MAG: hypothetical protein AAB393_15810, partial [Bacteroidota bacterium]